MNMFDVQTPDGLGVVLALLLGVGGFVYTLKLWGLRSVPAAPGTTPSDAAGTEGRGVAEQGAKGGRTFSAEEVAFIDTAVKSINYHFTRVCNYSCGFCFHTQKDGTHMPLEKSLEGIGMLAKRGMEKINFSGGEPFLYAGELGEMCKKAKLLGVTTTVVSNGSRVKESWFEKYGEYLDVFAVSVDSFSHETNKRIGRKEAGGNQVHVEQFLEIAKWCEMYDVELKINTTVCTMNKLEKMAGTVLKLGAKRWKVFQTLEVEGENAGAGALRSAKEFVISKEEFQHFLELNKEANPVPEDNESMRASYVLLDEKMRFLDCSTGAKNPTQSIFEIGLDEALLQSGFDAHQYAARGGDWYKARQQDEAFRVPDFGGAVRDIEDLNQPTCP